MLKIKLLRVFLIIRNAKRYWRTVRELNALTNRDLKDLGIHRTDIKRVARQCVYIKYVHLN